MLFSKLIISVTTNFKMVLRGLFLLGLCLTVVPEESLLAQKKRKERFEKYEIRVIRPRFFTKRKKFELGGTATVVTNQTFIYTYMATGLLTYHFTEALGIELSGTYGFSIDKEKRVLEGENFGIKTQILRTEYIFGASLLWTPIYGKYQLTSGKLIYFDTFILGGAGTTGIDYLYDHCQDPATAPARSNVQEPPPRTTVGYTTFIIGAGQRYFLNKRTGLNWSIRDHFFSYDTSDGGCPGEEGVTNTQHNITFAFGASRFF